MKYYQSLCLKFLIQIFCKMSNPKGNWFLITLRDSILKNKRKKCYDKDICEFYQNDNIQVGGLYLEVLQLFWTLREMCPDTEFFLVRIQSKYGKIHTRKNPVFGHFSRSRKNWEISGKQLWWGLVSQSFNTLSLKLYSNWTLKLILRKTFIYFISLYWVWLFL